MHSSRRFFYVAPFKKSLCKIGFGWNFKYWVCQNKNRLFFIIPTIFCQNEFAISTRFSIWVGNPKNILRKNNFEKEYSTLKDELLYAHTLSEFFKYCIVWNEIIHQSWNLHCANISRATQRWGPLSWENDRAPCDVACD